MRTVLTAGALALAAAVLPATPVLAPAAAATSSPVPPPVPIPPGQTPTDPPTSAPTEFPEVTDAVSRTVAYGKHRRQRMDVSRLPGTAPRPGVFLLHGGWWSSGDKRSMSSIARGYVAQGYTVFNVNYRLSSDAAWPAQRTDALTAVATAKRHAARLGFDPANYVIVGFSAGGHIAAAVGTYGDGMPGLKGVVGLSPVVSPLTAYADGAGSTDVAKRRLRTAAIKLAGGCGPSGKCERIWASMEVPWHASRGDAPMLAVHSQDEFVPPAQSELLKEQLRQVGVPMAVRVVPGTGHSSALYALASVSAGVYEWVGGMLRPGR
ncbi:alpha/beta hydrolase [Spongiactinospora sp. TRM90649]|uniref:alpha/beta hydrolase n=1 Tax=Spongiactinospora sp. TRM90649 TaxID=3031114 RepID=UPI0023F93946|nr:alpha/beta hydrolase [Spongiactinospora sp. TRM90649]MDF5755529.1 alpha/beta hydrolase [Spongiactinospora sp. TRM90649]